MSALSFYSFLLGNLNIMKSLPETFQIYCNWCGKPRILKTFEQELFKIRFCNKVCSTKHSNFMKRADVQKKAEANKRHLKYWHKIGKHKRKSRRLNRLKELQVKFPDIPIMEMFKKDR